MSVAEIAALVAATTSTGAFLESMRLYRKQAKALEEQRRVLIDTQAHRVTAWLGEDDLGISTDRQEWRTVTIENSGEEAVYGVRAVTCDPNQQPIYSSPIAVLPAHQRKTIRIPHHPELHVPVFKLSFMDSRKRHWVRSPRGGLNQVAFPAEGSTLLANSDETRSRLLKRSSTPVLQKEERPAADY